MKPQDINYCCCGCTLRTGSIIIGTLTTLNGAITMLMLLQHYFPPQYGTPIKVHIAVVLAFAVALFQIIIGIMLVMGADRNKAKMVHPWLLFSYFKFGVDSMAAGYAIYAMVAASIPGSDLAVYILSMALGLGVELYCIGLVYSFYRQLVEHGNVLPLKEEKV